MKNLILIMMLTLLAACGGGGGGSSSRGNGVTSIPNTPVDDEDIVYEYRLYVNGVAGTSLSSEAIRNFGDGDQANQAFIYTIGASETNNLVVFGRSVFWQIQKTGGGDLNVRITRDGVEVQNDTLTSNGQVITLTDNI